MKSILIFLTLIILSTHCLSAQYPTINTKRPRIYADSMRLDWLKNNIKIEGDCKNTFEQIVYAYNNWWINDPQLYVLGDDSTKWNWDWASSYSAQQTFLCVTIFKLSRDTNELKRCRFIARQIINWIDTANYSTMDFYSEESYLRKISDAGDLLLDWCYDDLPIQLRNDLVQALFAMNIEFMNKYIYSSSGNNYVSSHNTWNNIFVNQNTLALYNSDGLTSKQNDTVLQWFQVVYDKHINDFIPCWAYYRDDDGGWNWGAAYSMWSLVDQFQLFENMRIGTNKNFYKDLPWIQNSINQYLYFNQPDGKTIHLGDGETQLSGDRVIYLHSRYYDDPRSLWLSQYWSQPTLTPNTFDKYNKLLYKDFNMPTVSKPSNPLDWWSDKVGLAVSLSSWDSNATMLTFFNSPSKRAAHEHRDNNSFTIFKNEPLLIESGFYDSYQSAHYNNYYSRTIAHNSIVVFDSSDNYYNVGKQVSNDGGQIESTYLTNIKDISLPKNQRGNWKKFAAGNNYSYNVSDAQLSYQEDKLDFFRRRLLFIKPKQVIVLDNIHLKNTNSNQRDIKWIGHFVNQPLINGDTIVTQVPEHIETFNGQDFTSTNRNGNLAIRTLYPQSTTTTRIGGTDYEYWVDGLNYPPSVAPDSINNTPGKWRIEVRPTSISDSIVFMHTIDIGDNANISQAGGVLLISNISIGADWHDSIYFFSADAEIDKVRHVFDQVSGGRTIGIFAADLRLGSYNIKVDGKNITTIETDSNGIIQTSLSLMDGPHSIEIVSVTINIEDFSAENPIYLFPNPANTEINISILLPNQAFEIEVFNASSELVLKGNNKQIIDISTLAKGSYFVKIRQGGNLYNSKFIKE